MASIYKESQLTVAAIASEDGNGGCFSNRLEGTTELIWNSSKHSRIVDVLTVCSEFAKPFKIEVNDSEGGINRFFALLPLSHKPWTEYDTGDGLRSRIDQYGMFSTSVSVSEPVYNKELLRKAGAPLLQRAWVFQEQVLSPRMIHFGAQELVWECSHGLRCECSQINTFADEQFHVFEMRTLLFQRQITTTTLKHGRKWSHLILGTT